MTPPTTEDNSPITIVKSTLQVVFDVAVQSMDFSSGFLDTEEVSALRACARALGVDPARATPFNHHMTFYGHQLNGPYGMGACCEHQPWA